MEAPMNDSHEKIHKKFLDESHERAVRSAMAAASDDLLHRRKEREDAERKVIESRFERIEKRLERLESRR
jgi:hypothetical protein